MGRLGRLRYLAYPVLAVLVVLGGTRLVLSSGLAASRVGDRLSALLGVPVRVEQAHIAIGGESELAGLEIFEAEGERPDVPWVRARNVVANYSAVTMITDDRLPADVTLRGANIELRFDRAGSLLTRLPKPSDSSTALPVLKFDDATLTIFQEGHPEPHTVTGVTATLTGKDTIFRLEGTCKDAAWGNWVVEASYDTARDVFALALHCDRTEVTGEKLARLPFVSADVWAQVHFTKGTTPADIEVRVVGDDVKYNVRLKPENAYFTVTSIELEAEAASGEVEIVDDLVTLRNVKGTTASGVVSTEAVLDFRPDDPRLVFDIAMKDVELSKVPASWGMQELKATGKLTGRAKLDITILDDRVKTEGSGEGLVSGGTFDGKPLIDDLKLKLTAHEDRIRILPVIPVVPQLLKFPFGS